MSIKRKKFFKDFFHCFLLALTFLYISSCAFTTGLKVPQIQTVPDYQGESLSKRAFITTKGTVEYDLENQKEGILDRLSGRINEYLRKSNLFSEVIKIENHKEMLLISNKQLRDSYLLEVNVNLA